MKLIIFIILVLYIVSSQQLVEDQTNLSFRQPKDAREFIRSLTHDYTIGAQCTSSECPQTFLYSPTNTYRCPKAGYRHGSISWEPTQNTYYLWLSTHIPSQKDPRHFYATFNESNVVYKRYGEYELKIELEAGYYLTIQPCQNRDYDRTHCSYDKRDKELLVFKTFPDGNFLFDKCTFKMTKD